VRSDEKPARLTPSEARVLLQLEDHLRHRIVGKDEAVSRVANAVRTRRADLDFRPDRPDGSFLLVGPSGVGKNEFAFALAEVIFGDEGLVTALDMNDYQDEEAVDRLVATPIPGRDDVVLEGTLTAPVRANPKSVILLRGLEKAHTNVQRLVHVILDQGFLNDIQGSAAFNQTIIFATTLYTEEDLRREAGIGFVRSEAPVKSHLRELLKKTMLPELVNSFNEIIFLGKLTTDDVRNIARYKVDTVLARLRKQRRSVMVSEEVLNAFIREDEVQQTGATRLNRTLEEKLFHPLARYILEHRGARTIHVDLQGDKLVIR
jgi:ATP-dependent Clp protease ATP-binding subunit ClpA